ncbi:hypothetical protein [Halobacillus halophilus]|uniref:hypothetical protein n=1 Tax=Halobacillus halophilus TaxID=1570 RepID=UPI001CD231AE|nr:hypothetical protein [Halobacillus halophilus]MCA1010066.1 hypothetical protein [Halobacillus halophilus]
MDRTKERALYLKEKRIKEKKQNHAEEHEHPLLTFICKSLRMLERVNDQWANSESESDTRILSLTIIVLERITGSIARKKRKGIYIQNSIVVGDPS